MKMANAAYQENEDSIVDELIENIYEMEEKRNPHVKVNEVVLLKKSWELRPETYNKSAVFPFMVRKNHFGKHAKELLFVKQYRKEVPDATADFLLEKRVLPVIANEKIFADLIYFQDKHLRLYLEGINWKTLDERIKDEKESKLLPIIASFDTLEKHFNNLPKYKNKINRALAHEGLALKKLTEDYYKEKLDKVLSTLDSHLDSQFKENLKNKYSDIATLLSDETFYTIASRDAYPRHNMVERLIDAAGICECSKALHLGCTFGHPSVYDQLSTFQNGLPSLLKYFSEKIDIKENDFEKFLKATYAGAVFGNLRLAAGYHSSSLSGIKEFKEDIETAREQLELI